MIKTGKNTLTGNSFFIFIIRFFPSLANLLVMIWYARHLSGDVYGHYQNFWVALYVISSLVCLGIHVLIITYSPAFVVKLLKNVTAGQYALYVAWGIILSSLFALLQYRYVHLSFIVSFVFLLCFAFAVLLESFLIVFGNYKSLVVINILYSALYVAIHAYVLHTGFSLQAIFIYLLGLMVVRLAVYLGLVFKNIRGTVIAEQAEEFAPGQIRSLWLHLGFYDMLQVLFSYTDKFVISLLLSAQVFAVYFNGSQNIPFLPLLISAAGSAVLIQLSRVSREQEHADTISLMNQVGRMLSCIVFPVFFFLFFFRNEFILAVFTDKYIQAVPVFMVSILVLPVRAYHFTIVLQRMHKGAIINIGAIGDLLLACLLMYPLYKWMGLPGVALSFVISTYLQASFYLLYTARLMKVSPLALVPYANWLVKLIIFGLLFIVIHYLAACYFTVQISLLLGGIMMACLMGASLLIEFSKQRKYGRS